MIYNFEYELKLMLTETEYESLIVLDGCDAFKQVNNYFDTCDFSMYSKKTVIRIREKDNSFELTVKTTKGAAKDAGVVAMDENNLVIDENTAVDLLSGESDIRRFLPGDIIASGEKLIYVGKITTIRKKIRINEKLPMAELDKSIYDDTADYELEWEISEDKYNEAVGNLKDIGILIEGRLSGLSKYGRLVERLRKG